MVFPFFGERGGFTALLAGVRGRAGAGVFARTATLRDFSDCIDNSLLPSRENQPRCGAGKSCQTPLAMLPARLVLLSREGVRKILRGGSDGDEPPFCSRDFSGCSNSRRSQSFPYPGLLSNGAGVNSAGFSPSLPCSPAQGLRRASLTGIFWSSSSRLPRTIEDSSGCFWSTLRGGGWCRAHTFNRSGGEQREGTSRF